MNTILKHYSKRTLKSKRKISTFIDQDQATLGFTTDNEFCSSAKDLGQAVLPNAYSDSALAMESMRLRVRNIRQRKKSDVPASNNTYNITKNYNVK